MKIIKNITAKHITSEPGDCTRYDYMVYRNGDIYSIAPVDSNFSYPDILYFYDICDIETVQECQAYIENNMKMQFINPHTLLEVIRTIKELNNEIN